MQDGSRRARHGSVIAIAVLAAVFCLGPTTYGAWGLPGIFGTLTDRVGDAFDFATSTVSGIPGIVVRVGSLSSNLTSGFADVLGEVFSIDTLVGAVTDPSSLFGTFQGVLDVLKGHIEGQFSLAFSLVEDLSTGMIEYLEELGGDLTLDFEIIGEMLGSLTGDLMDAAGDLGEDLVDGIGDVVGDLGDIDELIGRTFDGLGISLFDGFASIDQLIGGAISGQIGSLETIATSLGALVTDPEKLADIFLSLAELGVVMSIMPMEQALAMEEARLEQMCAVIETLPLVMETLPGLVSGLQETHDGYLDRVVEFAGNLPEWLSSIPDLVEGKLRGAADSLASDITQLVGFIPGMEGLNAALGASDRTMTELLNSLTLLADSIEQGFAQLEQQLSLRGALAGSASAEGEPDDESLAYRASLQSELRRIEQENRSLQAENVRFLAARRAEALVVVMMAVQRGAPVRALVSVEGAPGGEAI